MAPAKRPNRTKDAAVPTKRRKRTAEEGAQGPWQARTSDPNIYNPKSTKTPVELFRKDLISAMRLPDSEHLAKDEYWVIVDPWKKEWERAVQVPVKPESLREPSVSVLEPRPYDVNTEFRLPKNKFIRITKDDTFDSEIHAFSNAPAQSKSTCLYDLDDCDVAWLKLLNTERAACGLKPVHEDQLEMVIERLELGCLENMHIEVDQDGLQSIYSYWKLKRKAGNNKPLMPPKSEDIDVLPSPPRSPHTTLSHKTEQTDLEKFKKMVQIRQDLERVRNLCYMVNRREKLSRSFIGMREQIFHKQAAVLSASNTLPTAVIQAVTEANHGPSIYDRLYSHNEAEDHTSNYDNILARMANLKVATKN